MRKHIVFGVLVLALAGCDLSKTSEGDDIIQVPGLDPVVILDGDLAVSRSTCEPAKFVYEVRASVQGLHADQRVLQIVLSSNCGGSASILGQSGDADIVLTSCGPGCGITAEAVMNTGSAVPAEASVDPCEALDCE